MKCLLQKKEVIGVFATTLIHQIFNVEIQNNILALVEKMQCIVYLINMNVVAINNMKHADS